MSHDENTGILGGIKEKLTAAKEAVFGESQPVEQRAAGHIEDFTQASADKITELREKGSEKYDNAKQHVSEGYNNAKESARGTFNDGREYAGDKVISAGEHIRGDGSGGQSYLGAAKEKIGEMADSAKSTITGRNDSAGEHLQNRIDNANENFFGSSGARGADQVQQIAEDTAMKVNDNYEGVEDFTTSQPTTGPYAGGR